MIFGLNRLADKTNKKHFCDVERTGSKGWKRGVALTEQTCPGRSSVEPLRVFTKNEYFDQTTPFKSCIYSGSTAPILELLEKMFVFFIKIESPHRTHALFYAFIRMRRNRAGWNSLCVLAAVMGQMHVITHTAATRRPP
jgi:hypothetical protein